MLSFRDVLESMIGSVSSVLENLWPSSHLRFLLFGLLLGTPIISFVIALDKVKSPSCVQLFATTPWTVAHVYLFQYFFSACLVNFS